MAAAPFDLKEAKLRVAERLRIAKRNKEPWTKHYALTRLKIVPWVFVVEEVAEALADKVGTGRITPDLIRDLLPLPALKHLYEDAVLTTGLSKLYPGTSGEIDGGRRGIDPRNAAITATIKFMDDLDLPV